MTLYTIRFDFTVTKNGVIYVGGEQVDLNGAEYELHKHKLEGSESNVLPIDNSGNVQGACCLPAPYLGRVSPQKISLTMEKVLTVEGSFFTPDTTVEIEGCTIDSIEFINSHSIKVAITAGSTGGFFNLTLNNGLESVASSAIELFNVLDNLVDLRLGGTAFSNSAIEVRSNMSFTRTPVGLSFSGQNPFSSWARFVGDNGEWTYDRSTKRKLTWLFTNTASLMAGFGSPQTRPTVNTQYREAEILAYFGSSTSFSGFYGNSGTIGSQAYQSGAGAFSSSDVKKLVLEDNGEPGSDYYLYSLPASAITGAVTDWLDESNLIGTGTINANMSADEPILMPFLIPRSGTASLFLGFILE